MVKILLAESLLYTSKLAINMRGKHLTFLALLLTTIVFISGCSKYDSQKSTLSDKLDLPTDSIDCIPLELDPPLSEAIANLFGGEKANYSFIFAYTKPFEYPDLNEEELGDFPEITSYLNFDGYIFEIDKLEKGKEEAQMKKRALSWETYGKNRFIYEWDKEAIEKCENAGETYLVMLGHGSLELEEDEQKLYERLFEFIGDYDCGRNAPVKEVCVEIPSYYDVHQSLLETINSGIVSLVVSKFYEEKRDGEAPITGLSINFDNGVSLTQYPITYDMEIDVYAAMGITVNSTDTKYGKKGTFVDPRFGREKAFISWSCKNFSIFQNQTVHLSTFIEGPINVLTEDKMKELSRDHCQEK